MFISADLKKRIQEFYSQYDEVIDIIIADKGYLVTKKDSENVLREARKQLKIELVQVSYQDFLKNSSLLKEGYSAANGNSALSGFEAKVMVKYTLAGLSKSERMRFYYSLYGRNKPDKGMVEELSLIKYSSETLLCPNDKIAELREYLARWRISFEEMFILKEK